LTGVRLERGEHYDWFDSNLTIILAATAMVAIATMIWRAYTSGVRLRRMLGWQS
jgi:hypothetical protein